MPDPLNFEALNQGAVAVPNAVNESIDKWDALNQNAKVADAMVRANPDLEQRMGLPDGAFSTLSAQDKITATTGYIKNQGVQEFQARMADYTAQANQRQQQVTDDQTAGTFLQNYLSAPPTTTDPDGTVRPTSPQERMSSAAGNTPGMSGRILPRVMDSLSKWQLAQTPPDDQKPTYSEDPVTGMRTVQHGKILMPSGTDPHMLQDGTRYSPDGRLFWSGKEWKPLKEVGYPDGATIKTIAGVNVVQDKDGRILKTLGPQSSGQVLGDVMNGSPATPPAPKSLSDDQAKQYLIQAGGDKAKARASATADGYTF